MRIKILQKDYSMIKDNLLNGIDENLLFLSANVVQSSINKTFIVNKVFIPSKGINIQTDKLISYDSNACIESLSYVEENNTSFISVHSHRTNGLEFSELDNESDVKLYKNVIQFNEKNEHFSMIMNNDGLLKCRSITESFETFEDVTVLVIGDTISVHAPNLNHISDPMQERAEKIFGPEGQKKISNLTVGVVGAGGNGSAVFEQLVRLGVGEIITIDFDKLETKNLARVYGYKKTDVGRYKVNILKDFAFEIRNDIQVHPIISKVELPMAINSLKACDFIFGALDGAPYARATLDEIKNKFYIPYLDLGMKVQQGNEGKVEDLLGRLTLLLPGDLCVMCTKVVRDSYFKAGPANQHNPYVAGMTQTVDPSVISYNTSISSLAVNMFLQYIHNLGNLKRDIRMSFLDYSQFNISIDTECKYCQLDLGDADQ